VFSPDGSRLATGGADGLVTVWDVTRQARLHRLKGHRAAVGALAFSADGRQLASADDAGELRTRDLDGSSAGAIVRPPGVGSISTCMACSPDGRFLATGHVGTVWLWDASTWKPVRTLHTGTSVVFRVAFSPDGRMLAAGDGQSQVTLWDLAADRPAQILRGWPPGTHQVPGAIGSLTFSPDGSRLAAGLGMPTMSVADYGRQIVKAWDPRTGNELGSWTAHSNAIAGLAFAPDGRRLATASHDGTVKLWEAGTWREVRSWKSESIPGRRTHTGHSAADPFRESRCFTSVVFSPDGSSLAAGMKDGTIVSWELATGRAQFVRWGHSATVYGLAYSPDGRTLASAGWDRLVKLWDARTGRELRALSGHGNWVMGLAFTPDGRALASFDSDGVLRPWRAPLGWERKDRDLGAGPGSVEVRSAENKPAVVPTPEIPQALTGRWEGTVNFDEHTVLRVFIRVAADADGRLSAVADSPDQGATDIPVTAMTLEHGAWSWTIASSDVRFEGKATKSGDAYEGEFQQRGLKMPLILKRTDRAR